MKKSILYFFGILWMVCSCSTKNSIPNIQTRDSYESTLTVDIDSPQPEYTAVFQLLFRGIADSSQKVPLIKVSEDAAMNSNPDYFDSLLKKGRYKTFITSSTRNSDSSHRVVINLSALKSDLEYHAIIRKFGY